MRKAEAVKPAAMTVGKNIERLRDVRGLSQVKLADKLRTRQPSLWKLEHSKAIHTGKTLIKVAKALSVSVDDLLTGVDADYSAPNAGLLTAQRSDLTEIEPLWGKLREVWILVPEDHLKLVNMFRGMLGQPALDPEFGEAEKPAVEQ